MTKRKSGTQGLEPHGSASGSRAALYSKLASVAKRSERSGV